MTTTQDLLIGPTTTEAPTTTLSKQDLSQSTVTQTSGNSDPKVWAVVAGLLLIAVGLAFATWYYWRATRPGVDRASSGRRSSRYSDLQFSTPESEGPGR